jgi:hypothetical protein
VEQEESRLRSRRRAALAASFHRQNDRKMAKEKKAKKKRKKKRKKDCQPRHRVKLNPLKAETAFRSQWKSMKDHTKEDHSNEQACEVLAKLVAVTSRARFLRFPPWCKKSRFS